MPLPYLISFILVVASALFLFYSLYILSLNTESRMHRIFFISCLCLSLWAFSLAISNTAYDIKTCLFWRRIGAFGWGPFFSLLLHFIIILTEKEKILSKRWVYLLIYLPAAVSVFVFGLYSGKSVEIYELIYTYSGWINISYNTIWDWFYNIYYLSFCFIGISMIFWWGKESSDWKKKKQVLMLNISFFIAIIVGTLSEFVINAFFSFKIPQMAPVFILIPMSVMFYCIKKYGFIVEKKSYVPLETECILSEDDRLKLYSYISLIYLIGGFVNFTAQYFSGRESLESAMLFGSLMTLLGLVLCLVQRLKIHIFYKDLVSTIITTVSIPVILLKHFSYSPFYAGIIPMIFIISSIAFRQRHNLIMNGSALILTLIWIFIKEPNSTVTFTTTDHLVRLAIILTVLAMAFYVNHAYIRRLNENEEKLNLQKMLSRISSIFVNTNDSNIDDRINEVLRLCGEHYKIDHVYVVFFSDGQKNLNLIYEWCAPGIELQKGTATNLDASKITEWLSVNNILRQGNICIADVAATSEESMEKEYMDNCNIRSMILNPLLNQDCVIGLMGFENVNSTICFKEHHKETLKVLAHMLSDIVLKVEAEKEIKYRANYDALTGLPNRAMFMSQLRRDIHMAKRSEKLVGVVFVDIDSFKYLNDTLGHDGGDSLLLKIGERISSSLRIYDIVARFGGDEFVIIIPQTSYVEDICSVAMKITESFKQPLTVNGQEFFVTVSMGISVFPLDGTEPEELVKNADAAMCVSKENGKNKYTLCSAFLKEEIEVNALLSNSLHLALQRNEFLLHYQPQVNAKTGEIVGAEALIRWNHPEKGIISPGVFIPLTEKNGLINHIGQWVLHEACAQNKKWQSMGLPPLRLAVNLSLGQFLNSNLVGTVESILKKTELDPSLLELEITESISTYDPEYIISTLNKLKTLGVMISIDDFGTEYSSLSRLKIMPVDKIKIDMRFIQGMYTGSKDESIVKVMLQLGKTFGLKVLAEGVENEEQLKFLRDNNCDEIQGFYFYKPMLAEELEQILKKKPS